MYKQTDPHNVYDFAKGYAMTDKMKEDDSLKRHLIHHLDKLGATSEDIGAALGKDSSYVRKLVPFSKIQKVDFGAALIKKGE